MQSDFPELFKTLMTVRGLSEDEVEDFLHPEYTKLHNPLLLPNMKKARDRIIEVMKAGERIMIFSDYDADGIPGAVVFADFFKKAAYDHVSFYIPHRHDEGFGLNCEAIDRAVEEGAKLLVTIDCGVSDCDEVVYANKKGVEVIITDHHLPLKEKGKEALPKAFAVVNPKIKASKYPFKELCGAAVAYKLVQAILEKERFGIKEGMEKWSLDMVGIATLSDMVPLVGENRIFAKYGLDVLRKTARPGLLALLRRLKIDQAHISEDDVAFMITPRINAASRMGVPMDAFNLLSTHSMMEAEKLAAHLETINNERKGIVASLVKDAKKHLADREEIRSVIVIGNPEWRPSLLGLVANSLVEEYDRPVFVWGRDGDGVLKGSCRTCPDIDLHLLMSNASSAFIQFGGHKGAGGFEVTLESLSTLEEVLSRALTSPEFTSSQNNVDTERQQDEKLSIELHEIGESLWKVVSGFAPFGTGNPKPLFYIQGTVRSAKNFGKTGDHLEVILSSDKSRDTKAIKFFTTLESLSTPLKRNLPISLTAHLEKSYFRNRPELRLRIVDIIGT